MKQNIGLFLKKRAMLTPLVYGMSEFEKKRKFTWAHLNERSNQVARMMSLHDYQPGDRVALLLRNGVEFLEAFFGLTKIGLIVTPLNWRLSRAELSWILKDCGARALIFDDEFLGP